MATNYLKSGGFANVELTTDLPDASGGFHMIGLLLGIALSGGLTGDVIAAALAGKWELTCEGSAFLPGEPLHFSVPNVALYSGVPVASDFANVAIAASEGGGSLILCQAIINFHFAEVAT